METQLQDVAADADWRKLPIDPALSVLVDLVEIHQRSGPIVDVTCGTGRVHEALMRRLVLRAVGYVGIDTSAEAVGRARERYPGVDFRVASGGVLPFPSGEVGAVICAGGTGPFVSLAKLAAECVRVARGHVFLELPLRGLPGGSGFGDEEVVAAFTSAGGRVLDFLVVEGDVGDMGLVRAGVKP